MEEKQFFRSKRCARYFENNFFRDCRRSARRSCRKRFWFWIYSIHSKRETGLEKKKKKHSFLNITIFFSHLKNVQFFEKFCAIRKLVWNFNFAHSTLFKFQIAYSSSGKSLFYIYILCTKVVHSREDESLATRVTASLSPWDPFTLARDTRSAVCAGAPEVGIK